jgi:hypothetical protein
MRSVPSQKTRIKKTAASRSTNPRPQESADTPKSALVQQNGSTNSGSTGINQLKPAKRTRNRVPMLQRERILQKSIAGKGITQIAREEGRNRETIARIVNGDQVQELVKRMRAEVYGLAYDAIVTVRHALQKQKDPRIAYKLLTDIGAIPLPAEAAANAVQARQPEPEELTSYERSIALDESGQINRILLGMARHATERAAMFDQALESADEVWHCRTVVALLDEMTYGQFRRVTDSDPEEYERLKKLADDILEGKRGMTDKEIVAVRKKYSE